MRKSTKVFTTGMLSLDFFAPGLYLSGLAGQSIDCIGYIYKVSGIMCLAGACGGLRGFGRSRQFPPASIIWVWVKLLCQVFLTIFGVEGVWFVLVEDLGEFRDP
jgi:hypothetical protein